MAAELGIFSGMNIVALPINWQAEPPPAYVAAGAGPAADWPLQPRPDVVHGFELPAKPWLPGHRGVDLLGRPGQPVLAATPGTVTYAGPLAGRGIVTITYGARRTTYEPVVADVPVGTPVQPGTVIGHLSTAASHCPPQPCLHWGLLQANQYLNPLSLLPHPPIRLLPLIPTSQPTTPPAPTPPPAAAPPAPALPAAPRPAPAPQPPLTPRAGPAPQSALLQQPALHRQAPFEGTPRAAIGNSTDRNRRAARLLAAATAVLTLTAGLLIRRQ